MQEIFNSAFEIDRFQFVTIFLGTVWFCLPMIMSLWVYVDATRQGFEAPWVWVLVTLLFHIFGVIIYIIARYSNKSEKQIEQTYSNFNKRRNTTRKRGPIETY